MTYHPDFTDTAASQVVRRLSRVVATVTCAVALAVANAGCDRSLAGYERIQVNFNVPAGVGSSDVRNYKAYCSPGKKVLGGGYHRPQAYNEFEVWTSQPSSDTAWTVEVWNKTSSGHPLVVIAVCAEAGS